MLYFHQRALPPLQLNTDSKSPVSSPIEPHVSDLVFQLKVKGTGCRAYLLALQIVMDVLENKQGPISKNR